MMNQTDIMTMYEAKTAKKVFLYRNGSKQAQPKCMVVNDRQIRDFSTFLNRVTSGLRAPVAVRNIYTPKEGHRVNKLDDLCSGKYYVAGGNEQFKRIKYGQELLKSPPRRMKNEFIVPQRSQQILIATSRYRLPVEKPFVIHVFRNGDEKYRGARVLLHRKIMGSWEHVLELVTEKTSLITPAKRMCTLDGRTIHAVSEIQDGGKYVALEGSRSFQKVSYCATNEKKLLLARSFPRAAVRLSMRHRSEHPFRSDGEGDLSDTAPVSLVSKRSLGTLQRRKSIRPMAGRKNKEGREKAIKDHREDSIFGGSPTRDPDESIRVARMPSPPLKSSLTVFHLLPDSSNMEEVVAEVEPDGEVSAERASPPALSQIQEMNETTSEEKPAGDAQEVSGQRVISRPQLPKIQADNGSKEQDGVFKLEGRQELEAETVLEGGDTEVEKPIDQEEAEEVEEEEGEMGETGDTNGSGGLVEQAKDIHLELQRKQTSVDLALQRAAPKTTSHSSSQEAIAPGTSSEPAQHHQASASGNSRPLSQHSVGSHTHTARTEEGVVEVAHEGPNEGEGGVLEELVEEVVEVEGTKGDMENAPVSSSTVPTPPTSTPQEEDPIPGTLEDPIPETREDPIPESLEAEDQN